jgi:hypothetical protein
MRIRTLKPEFWMHEGLCSCSEFSRLLAIALLNWADDEGYFMANPTLIKGQLFPFEEDSKKVPGSLLELSSVGWIELGEMADGRSVGRVLNFLKHQRVDKPRKSEIKDLCSFQESSKNPPRILQEASTEEWKGMEGNGKDQKIERADDFSADATKIVEAYPRRERWAESLKVVMAHLNEGESSQEMLAGTKACAEVIQRMPGGSSGPFVPSAEAFFSKKRWKDDPETLFRDKTKATEIQKPKAHANGYNEEIPLKKL